MKKSGWYYDIVNNFTIKYRQNLNHNMNNNGEYHHHDWIGPYKTFGAAKKAGAKELRARAAITERELLAFLKLMEPK